MKTQRCCLLMVVLGVGVSAAVAQRPADREGLAELKQSLQGLEWEKVDYDAQSTLERCRALMLFNHALDEIGAVAVAEADMMSEFLETQGLGQAYVSQPASDVVPTRTYEEGRKIAAALLKGPLADSRYATELSKTDDAGLAAYEKLYAKSCQDKWNEFVEPVRAVRGMAAFLKAQGKVKDYMAWAEAETERRQQLYEQEMADRRSAAAAEAEAKKAEQKARAEELEQQQRERAESRRAQQALYAAEQAQAAAAYDGVAVDDDDGWYSGWYYGVAANARRGGWYRDSGYRAQARDRVQQRQRDWHGAARPGGGGGGGGGRRR